MPPTRTITGLGRPDAVIDWLSFQVETKRRSHGGHLKGVYEHMGVSHVIPLNKGDGGAASQFKVIIQQPRTYSVIEKLLASLDGSYGLISVPTLCGLEVSLDYYHQEGDTAALQDMTKRLMTSVVPPVIENPRIVGAIRAESWMLPALVKVDPTKSLYIGNQSADAMWRVYWKRTDDTFIGEDGLRVPKPLPIPEWRARIEVRLQGEALNELQLASVSDLRDFSFERLHSAGLFKFAKRDLSSGPIFTNPYSICSGKAIGIDDNSPACLLNGFGRRDRRGRVRQLSRHLVTDTELTESSRLALRQLTRRFS